ncbi:MAG: dolichol kinase [Desulfurococcaceae archaeon]
MPRDPLVEIAWAAVLLVYILAVLYSTKKFFKHMTARHNIKTNVAVYYNRKIIHILAGGVTAFLVPLLFTSPMIPFIMALAIAVMLLIPHRKKSLLNWFQTSENMFEVNFCFAWGLSLLSVWVLTNNPYYAIIPPSFISIGDAVTGIIRNGLYGRRTKSWYGNLGMLATTIPIGLYYAGITGFIAAVVSSIVEHFEIPPFLDDNVLITLTSSIIIICLNTFA